MKKLQFVLTVEVPDDEDEAVVERRIDRMLENAYGYDFDTVDQIDLSKIHVHVWDFGRDENDPVEELDAVFQEDYGSYLQYGTHYTGEALELRIMKGGDQDA